ncbi:Paired amphipathic helix protein Sin3-like 4 [Linum grandiflorum]
MFIITQEQLDEAIAYVTSIKTRFEDKPETSNEFFRILHDHMEQRIERHDVIIERMRGLLTGHHDLLAQFNLYSPPPKDCDSDGCLTERKKPLSVEASFEFLMKIKARFQGDNEHVFKAFSDILHNRRKENKTAAEVHREVAVLFENHQDLLREFGEYAY